MCVRLLILAFEKIKILKIQKFMKYPCSHYPQLTTINISPYLIWYICMCVHMRIHRSFYACVYLKVNKY